MDFNKENKRLIRRIKILGFLKSKKLEKTLEEIPRHLFVPENYLEHAYDDSPIDIGEGQTISQPSTVVIMTEALDVKPEHRILEIGTGSGWQAAILSKLAKEIYTVERIEDLVEFAENNLKKLKIKNVKIFVNDGSLGLKEFAPYDRIIVTAACPDIPKNILEQLKINGKLVIPVGGRFFQEMLVITKKKDSLERMNLGAFVFVPLIGKYGFK
jgi:protein-L-isoaspartate(D-aspartate) O-methyltransferase